MLTAAPAAVPVPSRAAGPGAPAAAAPVPDRDGPGHQVLAGQRTVDLGGRWRFTTDPDRDPADWDTQTVPGNRDVHDRYAMRAAYAPVRSLRLAAADGGTTVTVTPRAAGELPSRILRGYRLRRHALAADGRRTAGRPSRSRSSSRATPPSAARSAGTRARRSRSMSG